MHITKQRLAFIQFGRLAFGTIASRLGVSDTVGYVIWSFCGLLKHRPDNKLERPSNLFPSGHQFIFDSNQDIVSCQSTSQSSLFATRLPDQVALESRYGKTKGSVKTDAF
jgi:hypothetical protein